MNYWLVQDDGTDFLVFDKGDGHPVGGWEAPWSGNLLNEPIWKVVPGSWLARHLIHLGLPLDDALT